MSFEEFIERAKESIKDYLLEEYQAAEVDVRNTDKINSRYVGMALRDENGVSPVVDLNKYYWDYSQGKSFESCMESMAELLEMERPSVGLQSLIDYEKAKEHLFVRVCGIKGNKEFLKNVPHTAVEDMAITYHVKMDMEEFGVVSTAVTDKILEGYGISKEELHHVAIENSEKLFPARIASMSDMLKEQTAALMCEGGMSEEEIDAMLSEAPMEKPMTVVTNNVGINGAAVLFYPNMMEQLAQKMEGDYFVLPSSVHETLLLPDNGDFTAAYLNEMVTSINETQVLPQERLTNEAYHYDALDKVFEKATAFEVRQKERAARGKAEEKESVLGKLGEKKETAKELNVGNKKSAHAAELAM